MAGMSTEPKQTKIGCGPEAADYERQAVVRTMRRDYYDETGLHRVTVCRTHDPQTDQPQHFLLNNMLEEAGILDGDEFEIIVTAADNRPHGDRRWIRVLEGGTFLGPAGNFRPETDDECLKRMTANER